MADRKSGDGGLTRLSFIKASAGLAAGAAAIGVPGAAALSAEEKRVAIEPSSPSPSEPVMAYVRDPQRDEVTVMSGTGETTYRDRALTQRLLDAAPQDSTTNGGVNDVLAP
jgi:hypothetical protein